LDKFERILLLRIQTVSPMEMESLIYDFEKSDLHGTVPPVKPVRIETKSK
jgi:hypothetical protein